MTSPVLQRLIGRPSFPLFRDWRLRFSADTGFLMPFPTVVFDNFDDNSISAEWATWGGGSQVVETNNRLELTSLTGGGFFGIDRIDTIDFTDVFAGSQLIDAGNQSLVSWQAVPILLNFSTDNHAYWIVEGNNVKCFTNVGGSFIQRGDSMPYDANIHNYFAIGLQGESLVFAWSVDGINWNRYVAIDNPYAPDTIAFPTIQIGTWQPEASATTMIVDDFTVHGIVPTVDLTPAVITFTAVPLDPVPQPGLVTLTPAVLTFTAVPVTPVPQPVTVNLTSAVLTFTAVPLPIQGQATLTPAVVTFTAMPVTPVPQPVQIALQPATMAFTAVAVTPVPQTVTVALTPAALTFTAVPVTPVPQPVTVSLTPAIMTFTAVALTPVPQPVTVSLVPAILTFTAVPLNVGGTVNLTPAILTFTAVPLTPVPGVVTVDLTPAVVTFTAQPLSPVAGGFASLVPAMLTFTAVAVTPVPQAVVIDLTPAQLIFTAVPLILPILDTEPQVPDVVVALRRQMVVGVIGEAMYGLPDSPRVVGMDGRIGVFGDYTVQQVEGRIT